MPDAKLPPYHTSISKSQWARPGTPEIQRDVGRIKIILLLADSVDQKLRYSSVRTTRDVDEAIRLLRDISIDAKAFAERDITPFKKLDIDARRARAFIRADKRIEAMRSVYSIRNGLTIALSRSCIWTEHLYDRVKGHSDPAFKRSAVKNQLKFFSANFEVFSGMAATPREREKICNYLNHIALALKGTQTPDVQREIRAIGASFKKKRIFQMPYPLEKISKHVLDQKS